MSNINTLINNAVKDIIFDKDYIVLIRDGCYTVISASDFLDYFVNGGQGVCDSVMNCWHVMGDFAGVHIEENGEDEECNCQYDTNPRIHFPKGEGIKIITSEEQAKVPDSIYILAKEAGEELYYELIIVDEAGNKRKQKVPTGSSGGTITGGENSGGGIPIYQGENADKIKIASIKSIGGSVAVSTDEGSVNLEVPVIGGKSSSNYGVPIYDGLDTDKKIKILPVSSGQINIQKKTTPEGQDYLDFDIPVSADETIKQFYVNEDYTKGGPSFEGNGSILKPYKKLTYALKAIVGDNGTLVNPQYQNSEILIQSNLTVNQEDLNNTPVLQNRISVNKITIKSSSNEIRTIYYKGTTESPLNTAFLRSLDPYTFISLSLINIRIDTETVKNIIYHKGDINNTFKTNNVVFVEKFGSNSSSYQDVGKSLFGTSVLVQNTITNNGGVVMIEGDGSLSSGTFNASNLFSIVSSSQTALRLKKTPIVFDTLNLEINAWRIPVDSPSTLKPKPNLYRLHSEDSWVRISNLYDSGEVQSDVGGYDSFIYLENPNTILFGLGLIVDSGSIYHAEFNNVLRIAGNYTSEITINKFISRDVKSHTGALLKISGDNITVDIESSKFQNVLSSTITRVTPYAVNAIVNHSQFNTIPSYPDDNTAKSIGRLIQGNLYLKNGVITRINS